MIFSDPDTFVEVEKGVFELYFGGQHDLTARSGVSLAVSRDGLRFWLAEGGTMSAFRARSPPGGACL